MLSKINRLPLRQEIGKLKARGTHISGKLLNLVVNNRQDNFPSRFACIVSTKVAKKAVERNRIKRHFYEAIGTLLKEMKGGVDVLIVAKSLSATAQWNKIKNEVRQSFKKIGIIGN